MQYGSVEMAERVVQICTNTITQKRETYANYKTIDTIPYVTEVLLKILNN